MECFECASLVSEYHEHHVVPRVLGGKKTVPLCEDCHSIVHGICLRTSVLTTAALAHKKSKGERVGEIPFGYTLASDGVALIESTEELQAIGLIRVLSDDGYSLREIARELDRRQIPTKDGKAGWRHTTVRSILRRVS